MGLMPLAWYPTLLAAAAAVFTYFAGSWVLSNRRSKYFPPGPPTAWVLGNALQIPLNKAFLKFHEWKDTYGDIIGLKIGPQNMVILSSAEHVRELFEKRGAIYSDRPQPYITSSLITPGAILFMKNDQTIKKTRTALRYLLGPADLRRILTAQAAQSALLMRQILESPQDFHKHLKYWALATSFSIISGQKVVESGTASSDSYYAAQDKWLEFLTPTQAPPVDLFPVLKYLPHFLAGWKREAAALSLTLRKIRYHMLDGAKIQHTSIENGLRSTENESLLTKLMRDGEQSKDIRFGDRELALFGAGTLDAAVDTTMSTTSSIILVMAAYPEVQKRIQAEVDSIWQDEVPGPEEITKAKYLKACMTETMRWRPAAPSGGPRVLASDDTYRGFKFVKGTTFLANVWSLHMDEEWYDKPEEFRPERYLDNQWGVKPSMAAAAESENRRPTYNFGAGRRICPGIDYAENQVLITVAKLAWEFDIIPKGRLDVTVETGYHSNLVMGPKPFAADFIPRSEGKKKKILEDSANGEKVIAAWVG